MQESYISLGSGAQLPDGGRAVTCGRRVVRLGSDEGIVYGLLRFGRSLSWVLEELRKTRPTVGESELCQLVASLLKKRVITRWTEDHYPFLYLLHHGLMPSREQIEVTLDHPVDTLMMVVDMMVWELADGERSLSQIQERLDTLIDHPECSPSEMIRRYVPPLICSGALSLREYHPDPGPAPSMES